MDATHTRVAWTLRFAADLIRRGTSGVRALRRPDGRAVLDRQPCYAAARNCCTLNSMRRATNSLAASGLRRKNAAALVAAAGACPPPRWPDYRCPNCAWTVLQPCWCSLALRQSISSVASCSGAGRSHFCRHVYRLFAGHPWHLVDLLLLRVAEYRFTPIANFPHGTSRRQRLSLTGAAVRSLDKRTP